MLQPLIGLRRISLGTLTPSVGRTSRGASLCAEALATCSGLAALAHAGNADLSVLRWTGALMLFFGAGFPVLMRWAPHEPSLLKVVVYASLLSPLVTLAAWGLCHATLDPDWVWPATFGVLALLQVASLGRSLSTDALGGAAKATLGLAIGVAVFWGWMLLGENPALRLQSEGSVFQSGLAASLQRGLPLENPWLAGTPLIHHPGSAALLSLLGAGLKLAPSMVAGWISVWSAFLIPLIVYLLAAPVFQEARRTLLAVMFGVLGWGTLCGWGLHGPSGTMASVLASPARPLGLYFLPGDGAAGAMLYALAGWLAASHGLRHGRRPWMGLMGMAHGVALVLHPPVGLAAWLATAAACGSVRGGAAVNSFLILCLSALPGFYLLRLYGMASAPVLAGSQGMDGGGAILWGGVPLLCACLGWLAKPSASAEAGHRAWAVGAQSIEGAVTKDRADGQRRAIAQHRSLFVAMVCFSCVPLALLWNVPAWGAASVGRTAGWALGILAAGGCMQAWDRGGTARVASTLVGIVLLVGGARQYYVVLRPLLPSALEPQAVSEHGPYVVPKVPSLEEAPGDGLLSQTVVSTPAQVAAAKGARRRHWGAALKWLRENYAGRDSAPILIKAVGEATQEPVRPSPIVLYANMPLWVDRWLALAPRSSRWAPRHRAIRKAFGEPGGFVASIQREWRMLGRELVFLVTEDDRQVTRGTLEHELQRFGAKELHREGTVTLWAWSPDSDSTQGAGR